MAHETLKSLIRQYINTNGQQAITGQILQDVLISMVDAYPILSGYATESWVQNTALAGYATENWVQRQHYLTSVSFNDLTSHPTTVDGYGITDAITTDNIASQSVNYATSAGAATNAYRCYVLAEVDSAYATVGAAKARLAELVATEGEGVGQNITVGTSFVAQWDDDSAAYYPSSVYSFIKISGGYDNGVYGQWLLSSYNMERLGVVGRSGSQWSTIKWLAWTNDIPTDNAQLTNGAGYITSSGSCAYAISAGDADKLDGYHYSAFAMIGQHNNLTASVNEFTTAANEQSGAYWWNYRTAGGLNGNITEYHFGKGDGNALAVLDSTGTILTSGNSSVSLSGSTLTVTINGVSQSLTDTNTWRGIQDNLTSSSAADSLSANQGRILNGYITTINGNINTLNGYFDGTGSANSAVQLKTSRSLWGQTFNGTADVTGNIEAGNSGGLINGFHGIELNTHNTLSGYGGVIDFHHNGDSNDYTSRIIEATSGTLNINSVELWSGYVKASRVYLASNVYLEYNSSNGGIRVVNAGLYADTYVSALGANSGGGVTVGDVTWALLAQQATAGRTIHASYISDALQGYLPISGGTVTGALNTGVLTTHNLTLSDGENLWGMSGISSIWVDGYCTIDLGCTYADGGDLIDFMTMKVGKDNGSYYKEMTVYGSIEATKFIKTGGTSAQFLKADGSVDGNSYLSLSGGTVTGATNLATTSGNVGIGTDTPSYKLDVNGYANCKRLYVTGDSADGYAFLSVDSDGLNIFCASLLGTKQLYVNGGLYVASASEIDANLYVGGDCTAVSFIQTSDIRKKSIVGDVDLTLKDIANAPMFHFTWNEGKDTETQHIGTSAQYWQGLMPELVHEGKDTTLAMQYDVIALAATITVARTVMTHEERIALLEQENEQLRKEIEKLLN